MLRRALRLLFRWPYSEWVKNSRRYPRVPPEPYPHGLEDPDLVGMWVAIDDQQQVRAARKTSRDLVAELRTRGLLGKVTVRFVAAPSKGLKVGLG